jgi:signal peptidase I
MKGFLSFIWEIAKIVVVALLIVLPIRYFLFQPFLVKGQSMEPNFGNGDYLIIDQLSYRLREPQRGEVVVFKYPNIPSQRYIKRIVGLPGETVEIKEGKVIISGVALDESTYLAGFVYTDEREFNLITLADSEYFVLGDNRAASSDSRIWGSLPREDIIGRAFIRAWPFAALAKIEAPAY